MYRLKPTIDLAFLLQATVEQICIGHTAIIINFDRSLRITILSRFAISTGVQEFAHFDGSASDATALIPLLGDIVVKAIATDGGGLMLNFESGQNLELFDTSDQFESFWIANGDQLIVV